MLGMTVMPYICSVIARGSSRKHHEIFAGFLYSYPVMQIIERIYLCEEIQETQQFTRVQLHSLPSTNHPNSTIQCHKRFIKTTNCAMRSQSSVFKICKRRFPMPLCRHLCSSRPELKSIKASGWWATEELTEQLALLRHQRVRGTLSMQFRRLTQMAVINISA